MVTTEVEQNIFELGRTLTNTANQLRAQFYALQLEADAQLALAAQQFLDVYNNVNQQQQSDLRYSQAHQNLAKATATATHIRDLAERSQSLDSKCAWWGNATNIGKQTEHVRTVVAGAETEGPMAMRTRLLRLGNNTYPGAFQLNREFAQLPANEWVAADCQRILAHDSDRSVVMAKLSELGVSPQRVTLVFASSLVQLKEPSSQRSSSK